MTLRSRISALEKRAAELHVKDPCATCEEPGRAPPPGLVLEPGEDEVIGTCPDCGEPVDGQGRALGIDVGNGHRFVMTPIILRGPIPDDMR